MIFLNYLKIDQYFNVVIYLIYKISKNIQSEKMDPKVDVTLMKTKKN